MSDIMSNKIINNNEHGLCTCTWANEKWHTLHCITYNYPECPTDEEKKYYKNFFIILQHVIPCCVCQGHYTNHIHKKGHITELTDAVFESKHTLTLWLYNFHKIVAESTGFDYDLSYEDVCKKYNSFVATCDMTAEYKKEMFKQYYNREAPIISYEIAKCFSDYAVKRGLTTFSNDIDITNNLDRHSEGWIKRNDEYWGIVKHMRLNSITGFEQDGEFKGLPTIEELKLIKLMSTSLQKKVIKHMVKKLGYIFEPVYKLVR